MTIICAWCQKLIGYKEPMCLSITHSICKECMEKEEAKIEESIAYEKAVM